MEFSSKEFPLSRFRASTALSAASDILHAQAARHPSTMGRFQGDTPACNLICSHKTAECRLKLGDA